MPLAPAIAAALNVGLPTRTKSLTIDGTDVLKQPGSASYGVDVSSIELSEAGPGQVSSLAFEISDPTGLISVSTFSTVIFKDITRGLPLFYGFVDTFSSEALGIGRQISVLCLGVECVLDWMQVPAQTFAFSGNTGGGTMIQAVVAAATGVSVPLNVATDTGSCTQAHPVYDAGILLGSPSLVWGGGSLRQCIQAVTNMMMSGWTSTPIGFSTTVDFYLGLRVWPQLREPPLTPLAPSDCASVTLSTAGANKPAGTRAITTAAEAIGVLVVGGNAAGSGVFGGLGGLGPVATINDANSLTSTYAAGLAAAYLRVHGATLQGTVDAEEVLDVGTLGAERRAFSNLSLTDTQANVVAGTPISRIDKVFFPSGTETWTISFGTIERLGSSQMRRLTRTVLN